MRLMTASARTRVPSQLSPTEAPALRCILNSRPSSCSFIAFCATAGIIVLGVPEGLKPPKATVSPFWINAATSCAVNSGIFMNSCSKLWCKGISRFCINYIFCTNKSKMRQKYENERKLEQHILKTCYADAPAHDSLKCTGPS